MAVTADGRLWLNSVPVQEGDLRRRLEEVFETSTQRVIIIKADQDVEYRHVMDAMDQLRTSGIEDMGLITDPRRGTTPEGE